MPLSTECSISSGSILFDWSMLDNLPCFLNHGSHRLEKYLNLEGFLEKSLKIKSALKSTHSKALKSPWILLFSVGLNTVDRDLNQYKIVVPLFGAANAAPNKGTTISYSFSSTNFTIISVVHFWRRIFNTLISSFPKLLVLENCKIVLRSPWILLKLPCMNTVFPKLTISKKSFSGILFRMLNSLDPDQGGCLSVLIWVQTVDKGYQQTICCC